jgi:hypothetical protein
LPVWWLCPITFPERENPDSRGFRIEGCRGSGVTYRLQITLLFFFLLILLLPGIVGKAVARDGVFTFWPLIDYRYSTSDDFYSWKFLGPFLKYENYGAVRQRALRPFYFRTDNLEDDSWQRELLYPVYKKRVSPVDESLNVLILWDKYTLFEKNRPEQVIYSRFTLFPLIFSGQTRGGEKYFAFFPFGGTIKNRFQRDEIQFFLFPFYSRTRRGGTTTHNILWPIYADIEGKNESGTKIWPLWGASEKKGVYRKRFFLWPFFFSQDLKLDSDAPEKIRAFFPFYVSEKSSKRSLTHIIWPFFSHIQDFEKDYDEWNFPWPLWRKTKGEHKRSVKFLPFFADERVGNFHKRWFLWPFYKIEENIGADYSIRRQRVLFFLYSALEEKYVREPAKNKKRIAFWPIFSYEKKDRDTHFFVFALVEPFFPENGAINRIWGPLWRIYQYRYDEKNDIEVASFLWNLYWKERRGKDLVWEFFPLIRYRKEAGRKKVEFLKGLFRYSSTDEAKSIGFLYLPWNISWKKASLNSVEE